VNTTFRRRRRLRLRQLLAPLAALALVVAACGGDDDDDASGESSEEEGSVPDNEANGVTSDSIKIGWMGDLTGPTASAQSFNAHGLEAYVECLNEEGGVLGRQIDLIIEDDQFSPETAAVNYTKLVQDDKVLSIVQMGNSAISTQLAPRVAQDQIAVFGLPQTIDAQLEGTQFFNNIAHYGDQADAAWAQIEEQLGGAENAVVAGISLELPSGQEWAAYMEQSVEDGGGTYVDTVYMAPTATEATAQVTQLQDWIDDEGVNYLSLHGAPGSALVVLQSMADAGIEIPTIGIHGLASNSIWENGPEAQTSQAAGMHSFLPANNDIEASEDMTRCAAAAGYEGEELIINFAHGFANGYILEGALLAAAETGELSRASFTEALRSEPWETGGITCPVDWTESQHSPCVAPFTYDAETGGMVPLNTFEFFADSLDGEYGITSGN
jgi:ABC-type branched-subunit amino acid transport system substrate-binding protein